VGSVYITEKTLGKYISMNEKINENSIVAFLSDLGSK
jgi:uncharacterized protein YneF (UPF0154 family)